VPVYYQGLKMRSIFLKIIKIRRDRLSPISKKLTLFTKKLVLFIKKSMQKSDSATSDFFHSNQIFEHCLLWQAGTGWTIQQQPHDDSTLIEEWWKFVSTKTNDERARKINQWVYGLNSIILIESLTLTNSNYSGISNKLLGSAKTQ
jgi:hypothetical protein